MKCRSSLGAMSLVIPILIVGCSNEKNMNTDNPLVDSTKIDQVLNDFVTDNAVVGLSVATLKRTADTTLIWSSQYGLRDVESQVPVNADTSFWLGSVSKAVMGTTLMIANEKGFFQLDDDVHGLITNQGAFTFDNPAQQAISIANLASHTSGVVDKDEVYSCAYYVPTENGEHEKLVSLFDVGVSCPEESPVSLEGFLAAYLSIDGEFYSQSDNFHRLAPGTKFEYSNIGAGLAGYLVEAITGQNLATYAQQEIFTPLAMSNTSWQVDTLDSNNIATPYVEVDDELAALPRYALASWPDGGLRSNATDLAKLLAVVINKGRQENDGIRLLSEASIEKMLPAAGADYGVFWAQEETINIDGDERALLGHTGSDPGAFSLMFFDPVSETGIVVVGNGDDDDIDGTAFTGLMEQLFQSAGTLN